MVIVDQSRIFLPPGSAAPPSALPLSFLDLPYFFLRFTVQHVLFYNIPGCSVHQFTATALPSIKRSLSSSLQRFYPLAGRLAYVPLPAKPYILCSDNDSVPFIAAVSSADFDELTSDSPQAASLLNHLVPPLGPSVVEDRIRLAPLLAVQFMYITGALFPNKGICIGTHLHHVAADAMGYSHFLKTWASICRADQLAADDRNCTTTSSLLQPVLDRSLIKETDGLETVMLEGGWNLFSPQEAEINKSPSSGLLLNDDDKLRATFTLSQAQIDRIKTWISSNSRTGGQESLQVSTFVATCAYTWTCLIKSREIGEPERFSNTDVYHFIFPGNCRGRLGYQIPPTYFGNCLTISMVAVKREELVAGRQGIVVAARAIGAKVKELEGEGGPAREVVRWLSYLKVVKGITEKGCFLRVTGTPRQRIYDTDFGWGSAWKSRMVHIGKRGSISLAESREGEGGGVEIGVALCKASMDAFCVIFNQGLRSLDKTLLTSLL